MKQPFLFLILFFIVSLNTAHSQTNYTFGVNLGGTFSNVRGNQIAEQNNHALDFLIGTSLEYKINDKTSVVTNLNYERKSYQQDINQSFLDGIDPIIGTSKVKIRSTLSYLSIPILLRHYFGEHKNFYINGGPFASFFLNSTTKVDGTKIDENANSIFRTSDFGLSIGIGTKLKINDRNFLNIELRDNLGLSNISKVKVIDDGSVKTNAFNLILNWEFSL